MVLLLEGALVADLLEVVVAVDLLEAVLVADLLEVVVVVVHLEAVLVVAAASLQNSDSQIDWAPLENHYPHMG